VQQIDDQSPITLESVIWKFNFTLSRASIGQIMVSFQNILKVRPKNTYESILYDQLIPATQKLINKYSIILSYQNKNEYNVKYYNLIVNLPNNISINDEEHGQIKLGHAKVGALIHALKQRIEFIIRRDMPELYKQDINLCDEFTKLQKNMIEFKQSVIEFENEFVQAINSAHKAKFNND